MSDLKPGTYRMTVEVEVDEEGYLLPHDSGEMFMADWWVQNDATFEPVPPPQCAECGWWLTTNPESCPSCGTPTGLGVSGEDRSEPTPAPREQWAVEHPDVITTAHNSPHSVLYTASKLPGGVIVTRADPDQPWTVETRCLCGDSKPADRHYIGCPDTSEVVSPEGTP